ncbi:MAG TPA: YaaR family protein [Limnochordia bacterium]
MRVEPKRRRRTAELSNASHQVGAKARGAHFSAALREAVAIRNTAERERLLQAVDEAAEGLRLAPGSEALWRYREAVGQFVGAAVRAMYAVEEGRQLDAKGRQRLWTLVRTIDEALEALTRSVLAAQADLLAIAARTDHIRGLLLDLYR